MAASPEAAELGGRLGNYWSPGELGASNRLDQFIEQGLSGYAELRDRPDKPNVSRL